MFTYSSIPMLCNKTLMLIMARQNHSHGTQAQYGNVQKFTQ